MSLRPVAMVAEVASGIRSCSHMQLPTMSSQDNILPRKLKFKITTKGLLNDSEDNSGEKVLKFFVNNGQRDGVADSGKKQPVANVLVKPSTPVNSKKRRPEMDPDEQRVKRQKMDRSLMLQCGNILRELMKHRYGWVFNKPVNPKELNIPDYFDIIHEPMDLGTIKHKLESNAYFGAEEFAADVRLTFSNAILYNPPDHNVHKWAKDLDGNFNRRWKLLESRFKQESKTVEECCSVDYRKNNGQDIKQTVGSNHQDMKPLVLNKGPLRVKLATCRPMSSDEKRKLRLELVQVSSKKMIDQVGTVFQKFGLTALNKERLDSYIASTDDGTLWKLKREIKVLLDGGDEQVKPSTAALNRCPSSRKPVEKEHISQNASESAIHGVSINSTVANCSCVIGTCHCRLKTGSTQASNSDLSSERSSEKEHCGDSKLDCGVKYPLAVDASSFALDTDGPGVVLNEESGPHLSTPATTADSVEGWTSLNVQLSPQKALRAALLKSRFADTIFKATHQVPLGNGEKSPSLRMQQERQRLEREQLKEKARIEAEIKAAEEASRRKQDWLKMQREREREAARMALQKMEKTVEIYENNILILKELETLCCGTLSGNIMKRLGLHIKDDHCKEDEEDATLMAELHIKDDYCEDEEDATLMAEEGEILS